MPKFYYSTYWNLAEGEAVNWKSIYTKNKQEPARNEKEDGQDLVMWIAYKWQRLHF